MHLTSNKKTLTDDWILTFKKIVKIKFWSVCPACQTTVTRLEAKRNSAWPPFTPQKKNLPVACALCVSLPSALSLSFYLQLHADVFFMQGSLEKHI